MRTIKLWLIVTIFLIIRWSSVIGQISDIKCLLPSVIMDEIIGEASGETALAHIIEMGGYVHNRPDSEYTGNFFETEYVLSKIKEYRLEGVKISRYPSRSWDGISAELWEISPGRSKLADYDDLPAMLVQGSVNSDVTAELVWIDEGSEEDIEKAGVEGKIAVTSGSPGYVHNRAVARGALGLISFDSPRPLIAPLAIPMVGGISGGRGENAVKPTFAFYLPPREGYILRNRLEREKIKVHAVVRAQNIATDMEVTEFIIPGSDPEAGEIIFSAHLFEGYVKQGANDNISGSAVLLEIGRMFRTLINEGRIPKPLRTMRFILVPEFSGTAPWSRENKELLGKTLCNINMDMVGINLSANQSFLCMHRTTYGNPHYINDVVEHYYHYVGLGNRTILGMGSFIKRIVAPSGTDDPFYYAIVEHSGGSDHEVFNDWGVQVPGIMMITWPDPFYHTSEDEADKCDPTQLKRVAVIGAAAAYTIASADNHLAMRIASEVSGNAIGRIGEQFKRAVGELKAADKDNFKSIYMKARGYIEAAGINEKATINSVRELYSAYQPGTYTEALIATVDAAAASALKSYDQFMISQASSLGVTPISIKPSALEKQTEKVKPVSTARVTEEGYQKYIDILKELPDSIKEKYQIKNQRIDRNEVGRLCNGINTVNDIKKMMDAQTGVDYDLGDIYNMICLFKEAGLVSW